MEDILIDTNIVVWYFGDYSRLSKLAEKTVDDMAESGTVFVAAITIVELTYLIEKERIPMAVLDKLRARSDNRGNGFASRPSAGNERRRTRASPHIDGQSPKKLERLGEIRRLALSLRTSKAKKKDPPTPWNVLRFSTSSHLF